MARGGKRDGAGRPKGQGKYKETTTPIRVPDSLLASVKAFINNKSFKIPLYASKVQAGFPSFADDYVEGKLDLNEHLIKHPSATFFVRATGESMINAGIHPNDILVVDRSITPINNKIVIAVIDGNLTVKRLKEHKDKVYLAPENPKFKPIEITQDNSITIWGVVTTVIHSV